MYAQAGTLATDAQKPGGAVLIYAFTLTNDTRALAGSNYLASVAS